MKRKCSMCGSYKEQTEFRYMKKQDRYNCYCKDCEKLYNKEYQRIYRERKKQIVDLRVRKQYAEVPSVSVWISEVQKYE